MDWTHATNTLWLYLAEGDCTLEQFASNDCPRPACACRFSATSEQAAPKPRVLSLPTASAGTRTLFAWNRGPREESCSYQAVLTTTGAASASTGHEGGEPEIREATEVIPRPWPLVLALAALTAGRAEAQGRGVRVSIGYAFSQYLEEGGGNAPVGAYLSIASAGRTVGFEADVANHRDAREAIAGAPPNLFGEFTIALHTVTAGIGPKFELGSGRAKPFLHVLGGLRYDTIEGESNTSYGGLAGLGVDIPAGSSLFVRLGADFEIFFDQGKSLKTLRLAAGLSF